MNQPVHAGDGAPLCCTPLTLDGKVLPGNEIPLLGDGCQHQVQVLTG
jgi:hypothetical protein